MADQQLILTTLFQATVAGARANILSLGNAVDAYAKKVTRANATLTGQASKVTASEAKRLQAIEKLNQAQEKTAQSQEKTKRAIISTDQTRKKSTKSIKQSTDQLHAHGKQLSRIVGAWDRVKAAARVTLSYGLAATAIYAVVNAMKAGIQTMAQFDQNLKNLEAITGASAGEVLILGEAMKQVARDTKYTTDEIGLAMQYLGQAGFSAEESLSAVNAVAMLATGTLSSLENTSDLLTTTIRAFSFEASEAGRVADVMAASVNNSKLTIDKLRTAFNYVGSAASKVGLSLEEAAASMQILANAGLRASTIGTGLRQVLSKMVDPNRNLTKALDEAGIAYDKINPATAGYATAMKSLIPLLYKLEEGADGNKKAVIDMAKAYDLFKLRGAQAAAILVEAFASGDFEEVLEQTYRLGIAEEMAATQGEGLVLSFQRMIGKAKLLAVSLGENGIVGILKIFVTGIEKIMVAIESFLSTGLGSMVTQFALLMGTIAAVLKAFGLLKAVYTAHIFLTGQLGFVLGLMRVAYTEAAIGAGILTGALAALKIGIYALFTSFAGIITIATAVYVIYKKIAGANKKAADTARVYAGVVADEVSAIEILNSKLSKLEEGSIDYIQTLKRFQAEHGKTADEIKKVSGAMDLTALSMEEFQAASDKIKVSKLSSEIEYLTDSYKRYGIEVEKAIKKATPTSISQDLSPWHEKEVVNVDALAKKYKFLEDALDNSKSAYDVLIQSLVKLNSETKLSEGYIQNLDDELEAGGKLVADFTDAVEKHAKAQKEIQLKLAREGVEERKKIAEVDLKMFGAITKQKIQAVKNEMTDKENYIKEGNQKILKIEEAFLQKVLDVKKKALEEEKKLDEPDIEKIKKLNIEIINSETKLSEKKRQIREQEKKAEEEAIKASEKIVEEKKQIREQEIKAEKEAIEEKKKMAELDFKAFDAITKQKIQAVKNEMSEREKYASEGTKKILKLEEDYLQKKLSNKKKAIEEEKALDEPDTEKIKKLNVEIIQAEIELSEKKRQIREQENKEEEEAMNERINLRKQETVEVKKQLENQLFDIKKAVYEGTMTKEEGQKASIEATRAYYEKEIKEAERHLLKTKLFFWTDVEEKKAALEERNRLVKASIDFEISEEKRLANEKQKLRGQTIDDNKSDLELELKQIDLMLAKGVVNEQTALDTKAKIKEEYYDEALKKATAYYNAEVEKEGLFSDSAMAAKEAIGRITKERIDFEISELKRAEKEEKNIMARRLDSIKSQSASKINTINKETQDLLSHLSKNAEEETTIVEEANEAKIQAEFDALKKIIGIREENLRDAYQKAGAGTAIVNNAIKAKQDAELAYSKKQQELIDAQQAGADKEIAIYKKINDEKNKLLKEAIDFENREQFNALEKRIDAEQRYLNRKLSIMDARTNAEGRLNEKLVAEIEKSMKKQLDMIDKTIESRKSKTKEAYSDMEGSEKNYNIAINELTAESLKYKLDINKKYLKNVDSAFEASIKNKISLTKELSALEEKSSQSKIDAFRKSEDDHETIMGLYKEYWKAVDNNELKGEKYRKNVEAANKRLKDFQKQQLRDAEDQERALEKERKKREQIEKQIKTEEQNAKDLKALYVALTEKIDNLTTSLGDIEFKLEFKDYAGDNEKLSDIDSRLKDIGDKIKDSFVVEMSVDRAIASMNKLISKINEAIRKKDELSSNSSGGYIPGFQTGGFIQKRLGGIINWLAGGGKLGGYGGGDRVPAMLEAGEYVIRKEAVKKYGQGLFGGLNQMKVNTANIANAVHARLGGMMAVPRFQTPAYQAGGSVNVNFPDIGDYGVVRIESGGQQFPVIMKTDIIGEFKSAIKKERLTRSQ